jgi:hypothetical protein
MAVNRQLIDTIKKHFAGKATAQLQEIVRVRDVDRWSEEAFAAAQEVIQDREAGRAKAPRVPVEDAPPPSRDEVLDSLFSLATVAAAGVMGAGVVLRPADPAPDPLVAIGANIAWLAVETTKTEAVAAAFSLRGLREVLWPDGVSAAYRGAAFVTPPLGDWTLVASTSLFPPEDMKGFVTPHLLRLSQQFGDAQYFCAHREAGLHAWARAKKGTLLRGYAWLGQRETVWNEGQPTKEERNLRLPSTGAGGSGGPALPHEDCVLQLASLWSVDPTAFDGLESHFQEPVPGLVGELPTTSRPN